MPAVKVQIELKSEDDEKSGLDEIEQGAEYDPADPDKHKRKSETNPAKEDKLQLQKSNKG